jgi:hypothetical protein
VFLSCVIHDAGDAAPINAPSHPADHFGGFPDGFSFGAAPFAPVRQLLSFPVGRFLSMQRRILIAAIAVLGTACTSVKSADLETSGMSAHIAVTADSQGNTVASAELTVDNDVTDFVDLTPGDSFAVKVGSTSQSMIRSDVLGIISYSTTFGGQGAPGTTYDVALNRKAPGVSAPSSTCTIPQPFEITSPASGLAYSRGSDGIVVTYSNAGQSDPVSYQLSGPCVNNAGGTVPGDSGSFTIAKSTLVASGGSTSCTVSLTVTRVRSGQLDPAYGYGGAVNCEQARSITFVSNP